MKRIESLSTSFKKSRTEIKSPARLDILYGCPFLKSLTSWQTLQIKEILLSDSALVAAVIRFMMLNRSNDVELDFDFDKVLEKTRENPVFYVQYSYARISSLFRTLDIDSNKIFDIDINNFELNSHELNLFRKILDWPKVVETASAKYEPHRIPFYLYELATLFHSYWSKGNEDPEYKFISAGKIKNKNTLLIIKMVSITFGQSKIFLNRFSS